MFNKILIANRGEIACRIIRTARRMGIQTVAIYSQADTDALHVKMADEAYYIGKPHPQESYLQGQAIIRIALDTHAGAIHPGYGFLSENALFAQACQAAGICFIGPSVEAIRSMGEKNTAKNLMQAAGIPVIPGYQEDNQEDQILQRAAEKIGYPILIKAVAGGGGKGMRIVTEPQHFLAELKAARSEAKASFNDDRVLLEKYLPGSRHVEVQVFADNYNNAVYLFERDCSIQRRHQKIIEEAPAPQMEEALRSAMGKSAIAAVRSINYRGAGTIEFLLTPEQKFYFMEMNTRLQVEHGVTEMITGLDLVEWQLRVAAGEKLPILDQNELSPRGHAIEVRICAEDPQREFMPATGTLVYFKTPDPSPYVRIDTGFIQGDTISAYYDSLIAKLLVWGQDRQQALSHLEGALADFHIVGLATNISFLQKIIDQKDFRQGQLSTNFIEQHRTSLWDAANFAVDNVVVYAALAIFLEQTTERKTEQRADLYSPWMMGDSWRLNLPAQQVLHFIEKIPLDAQQQEHKVILELCSPKVFIIHLNDVVYTIENPQWQDHTITAVINQQLISFEVFLDEQILNLFCKGQSYQFSTALLLSSETKKLSSSNRILSPMPGTVVEVFVQPGQSVSKGDRLLTVEAMKMQHTLYAQINAQVKDVFHKAGELVDEGMELITFNETPMAVEETL